LRRIDVQWGRAADVAVPVRIVEKKTFQPERPEARVEIEFSR